MSSHFFTAFFLQFSFLSSAAPRSKYYFFCTYFKQSRVTATRIMIPEKINCRLVSIPRMVRE